MLRNTKITQLIILLLTIKITQVRSSMLLLSSQTLSTPAHIYSIYCQSGGTIVGSVTWNSNSDVDACIYGQGSDFYGTALRCYTSTAVNI